MTKKIKRANNLDVRHSVAGWTPYLPLDIVWDDTGNCDVERLRWVGGNANHAVADMEMEALAMMARE